MLAHKQHLGPARPQQQLVHHSPAVLHQHQSHQQPHHHHHHLHEAQQPAHLHAPVEQPPPAGYYQPIAPPHPPHAGDSYALGEQPIAYQGPLVDAQQPLGGGQKGFTPRHQMHHQHATLVGEQQQTTPARIYQQQQQQHQQYQHQPTEQPQVPPQQLATAQSQYEITYSHQHQQPASNEPAQLMPQAIRRPQQQQQQQQPQPQQPTMRHQSQQPYQLQQQQQPSQAPVRVAAQVGGGSGARLASAPPQSQYAKQPVGYAQSATSYQQQPAVANFVEQQHEQPQVRPQVLAGQAQVQHRQQYQQQHSSNQQQYPSSSPTLLQQQLNRQQPQAQHLQQHQQQQPLVKQQAYQQQPARERQRYPGEPEAFGGQQAYPVRGQQVPRGANAAMGPQQPQPTAPHLLGNPTPPLTPTSAILQQPVVASRQQQQHPAAAEQWQVHQQHHLAGPTNDQHQHHAPLPPAAPLYVGPQAAGGAGASGKSLMAANHHHQHQHHHQLHSPHQPQHSQHHHQQLHHPNEQLVGQQQARTTMPKSSNNQTFQLHRYAHNNQASQASIVIGPTSHQQNQMNMTTAAVAATATNRVLPAPTEHSTSNNQHQAATMTPAPSSTSISSTTRLTLPLREPLMGPFRLEHDAQFTSKVFHLDAELFEILSKSMCLNQQTAAVTQELQFRAYLIANKQQQASSDSLLASNHHQHHHHHHQHQHQHHHNHNHIHPSSNGQQGSIMRPVCNWPELFQVSVNQNIIHLDRSKPAHKANDIFQFCQLGDNILDIQVNDCYCTHEFVLEPVDRPTLKAFVNSCFKSRLLAPEDCIQKMKHNSGLPGFLVQSQHIQQTAGIFNEYISEFVQGIKQTRTRISLRCPISIRRMRTPARGHNCKHLQCFDLESFLFMNRDRSQWSCPICSLPIPFNMLELDKHQLNIIQAMCDVSNTDDILIDISGQWQAYYGPAPAPIGQHQPVMQQQTQTQLAQSQTQTQVSSFATAKSTGTYHPQPPMLAGNHQSQQQPAQPLRPMSANLGRPGQALVAQTSGSPAPWEAQQPQQHHVSQPDQQLGPVRRPASAIGQPSGGRRSTSGSPLAKKPYQGSQYAAAGQPAGQFYPAAPEQQFGALVEHQSPAGPTIAPAPTPAGDEDELSPLAAMERAIIQHEQQMGPPPFDPTSLTSSPARPVSSGCAQPAQAAGGAQQHHKLAAGAQSAPTRSPVGAAFSPHNHPALSPAGRVVSASPQHQLQRVGSAAPAEALAPQSPMQPIAAATSISTPATPSMLVHGGPETPATPGNSTGGHLQQTTTPASSASSSCSSSSANYSPHLGGGGGGGSVGGLQGGSSQQQQSSGGGGGVDHQPLSNGSASAGSITSSSTMTPSGQSLGSVGMGSDSRCGTAPLQTNPIGGLDELLHSAGSSFNSSSLKSSASAASLLHHQGGQLDHLEKNEILIGKLMDSRSESLLRDNHHHHQHNYNQGAHNHHHAAGAGELAIALEEAEWKQQLDRGKSEHLANFLNEPLMNKKPSQQQQQQQYHHKQMSTTTIQSGNNGEQQQQQQQLIAGSQTDDTLELHGSSSPVCANLDQLTDFANYLDADAADDGAGLPPDDSILDLFER